MKNSSLIWIPSLQNYLRFEELDNDQYRTLLKVLDDPTEIEFFYQLNKIIGQNILSDFDTNKLTTVDRFIVCVFLKMRSCSPHISLTKNCEKCKTSSSLKIDLEQLILSLAPKIDRKFGQIINFNPYSCLCDIPSIKTEYDIFSTGMILNEDRKSLDNLFDNYIMSHIRKVWVNTTPFDFDSLELLDKKQVFSQLPAGLTDAIRNEFLSPIHDSLSDISFVKFPCKCGEVFDLNFQINFISDLIKIVFRDNSVESILLDTFNLASTHIDANFLMKLSPKEMNIMTELLKESHKQKENSKPEQKDLFESPSEFT